ncbi:hypothetical protein F4782DRAFT_525850 [Xylaria castorea]|nr:hypothetical protein F4782DRAFT_525850 [Xylaria castorea]
MGGHRYGQTKGGTGRARDSVDDRALVSLSQRPVSPENAHLAMPRPRPARGTGQRRESAYGRAEAERTPSFSSSSASMVGITRDRHGLSQNQQTLSPGQVRGTGKPKILCHNWGNNGKCKFGKSCRYRHEMPPSAPRVPREEPPEAGPAYYPSWGRRGMQGAPVVMMPAFLPQESLVTRRIRDVAPSMYTNEFPRPSNLSKSETKKKNDRSAPSPRQQQQQQQQQQQHGNKPANRTEKHASRYDSDKEEQQRYQQHRAVYTTPKKSKAKATEGREHHRSSWDEGLASLNVENDTTLRHRASYSPSGGTCDTCSFYDHRNDKRVRALEEARDWHVSSPPDAFESKTATAAAAEEKWKREQQERAAHFKVNANKADGGRAASVPASSPGTSNNKRGYHPNQSPRSPKSRAQNKNLGSKGEGKKGYAHIPKAKTAHQNQQRHEQRSLGGSQQPGRMLSSADPFKGEIATVAATKNTDSKGESKSQAHTPKTKAARHTQQHQNQQRNSQSSSGQQPRGRSARATPAPAGVQRRVSYSPDAFDDEIAMAAAAETEKWKREQAQAVKIKAETTSIAHRAEGTHGPPKESQHTRVSGRPKTRGDKVQNLIDI